MSIGAISSACKSVMASSSSLILSSSAISSRITAQSSITKTSKGKATSTSTKSSSPGTTTLSSATISMSTSAMPGQTLYPIQDPSIKKESIANLVPADVLTLEYAEKKEGGLATSVIFDMFYPAVALENSAFILDLRCTNESLSFRVDSDAAATIVASWPQQVALVTRDGVGCQNATERGIFLSSSWSILRKRDTQYQFNTGQPKTWSDVAESMNIRFGSNHDGDAQNFTSSSLASWSHVSTSSSVTGSLVKLTTSSDTMRLSSLSLTPLAPATTPRTITTTMTTTTMTTTMTTTTPTTTTTTTVATTTTTERPVVSLYTDLSAGAKEIADLLMANVGKAANGDFILPALNPAVISVPDIEMSPSDAVALAAAEAAFKAAGMDTPDKMAAAANKAMDNELADTCPLPMTKASRRRRLTRSSLFRRTDECSNRQNLPIQRRDDDGDDDGWDTAQKVGCDDTVGGFIGVFSETLASAVDLACKGKDL